MNFELRSSWYNFYVLPGSKVLYLDSALSDEMHNDNSYDYIICLPAVITLAGDVQNLLSRVQRYCHARTRVIIIWYMPWFRIGSTFSLPSIKLFALLTGFDVVVSGRYDRLHTFVVMRPCFFHEKIAATVSVVIPCRNERGTVEDSVKRCPEFGSSMEFLFVDGHSEDGTLDELYRVQKKYANKNIKILEQKGQGKGDAVRLGFEEASGDVLMILDSDLAVPPEELPKFYDTLVSGVGECINGSRLIYPMEDKATPWLNYFANRAFAWLISKIVRQKITDTLCGTKVLWRQDYCAIAEHRAVFGTIDPFGDFDLLFGAARLSKKIIDVPVHFKNRVYGSSQIGSYVKNGLLLLRMSLYALWQFTSH